MFTGLKKQLEISDILIENILPPNNELVKLRKILNWDLINEVYKSCFKSKLGNKTKTTDIALGLILLKHLYKKSDRALISELHLNNAYMYFCNVSYDEMVQVNSSSKKLIDHSTLVKIRKRIGAERIEKILALFISELVSKKIIDGTILFTDTTSLEKKHKIVLAIPHKKRRQALDKKRQALYDKRSSIEAKISEAKRACGLNKSYYNGFEGDRMWASLAIMATNMKKLLRDINKNPELILRFT